MAFCCGKYFRLVGNPIILVSQSTRFDVSLAICECVLSTSGFPSQCLGRTALRPEDSEREGGHFPKLGSWVLSQKDTTTLPLTFILNSQLSKQLDPCCRLQGMWKGIMVGYSRPFSSEPIIRLQGNSATVNPEKSGKETQPPHWAPAADTILLTTSGYLEQVAGQGIACPWWYVNYHLINSLPIQPSDKAFLCSNTSEGLLHCCSQVGILNKQQFEKEKRRADFKSQETVRCSSSAHGNCIGIHQS